MYFDEHRAFLGVYLRGHHFNAIPTIAPPVPKKGCDCSAHEAGVIEHCEKEQH